MKTKEIDLFNEALEGAGEISRRKKKAPKGLLDQLDAKENLQATLQRRICANDTVAFCGGIYPVRSVDYEKDTVKIQRGEDILILPREAVQKVRSVAYEGRAVPRIRR